MSFGASTRAAPHGSSPCPCGSGAPFASCCGPVLAGAPAPTPERLMRSRFTAFRTRDAAHLERTWHPRTRPGEVTMEADVEWVRLEIVDAPDPAPAEDEGIVEFRAHWRAGSRRGALHERSRFARRAGRWLYVDGAVTAE